MILRNRAKCNHCKDIIESKHRKETVSCSCWKESKKKLEAYPDRLKYELDELYPLHTPEYEQFLTTLHGITVSGGLDEIKHTYFNVEDLLSLVITCVGRN